MGLPSGAPWGSWRVGGKPWDGPLALPRKGGVQGAGAGAGPGGWGGGGTPVRGIFRAPAPIVTRGDTPAEVQQTAGGEGSRRYSTSNGIHITVQVDR